MGGEEVAEGMRNVTYAQILVMAAIVATLFLAPAAGLVWVACALLGMSFEALVTFGGSLNAPAGMAAWWALSFIAASAYAALMLRD